MSIEGLRTVLEKEAIVATPSASDLMTRPEAVDVTFRRHVRTYVPLGRASGSDDDSMSIAEYEKRVIDLIHKGGAPKGYLTAEYGYGKTSTALYLWHRCREAGILAVPPFQLEHLGDLLTATTGWARYELERMTPGLGTEADSIHRHYSDRNLETLAEGDERTLAVLQAQWTAGNLSLNLNAADYIAYFEEMTALALRGGFEGLLVLPDEIQQYIEPSIRAGRPDPIAPLFNVVQAWHTRRGYLRAGLVLVIPAKELGVINDQRGDLVQRLKDDRLGFDLRTIYDAQFAGRLWGQLATEFDFKAEAQRVISPDALSSLGQIAARADLANGPRTVVAGFQYAIQRHIEGSSKAPPLTPIGLVEAFLAGNIRFDYESKLQNVTNQHLASPLVVRQPEYVPAVKLLAAFPTSGATPDVIERAELTEVVDELDRLAHGEIVITMGGGIDNAGNRLPQGYTLLNLEPHSELTTSWLIQTLKEYTRAYVDESSIVADRVREGFCALLRRRVLPDAHWKLREDIPKRLTDSRSFLFEGSFPLTQRRYPERQLLVRVLVDDEEPRGALEADIVVDFVLRRNFDVVEAKRRGLPGQLVLDRATGCARVELNLYHRDTEEIYGDLQTRLQPVVSPHRVTPLLMLSFHELLEEKRRASQIPGDVEVEVTQDFQPALIDHSLEELFNAGLGTGINANGPRIVEVLFQQLCESRFPAYDTVMQATNWPTAFRDYRLALSHLDNRDERQGTLPVVGTKREIAERFNRSNTSFDTFAATFTAFIEIPLEAAWKSNNRASVRFTLHPFEQQVIDAVRVGSSKKAAANGAAPVDVRFVSLSSIFELGESLGYRRKEVDELLEVMRERQLVEFIAERDEIHEFPHAAIRVEDLRRDIAQLVDRFSVLQTAWPEDADIARVKATLLKMQNEVAPGASTLADTRLGTFSQAVSAYEREYSKLRDGKLADLRGSARRLTDRVGTDLRQRYRLHETLDGNEFAPLLNVVAQHLLDRADALQLRSARVRDDALELLGELQLEQPEVGLLVSAREQLVDMQARERQSLSEHQELDARCQEFEVARRVQRSAVDFSALLDLAPASEVVDVRTAFDAFTQSVQAELSSRKELALGAASTWETELQQLRGQVTALQLVRQSAFDEQLATYRALLEKYLNLPVGNQVFRTSFNPRDPDASERDLQREIVELINGRLTRILENLETWRAQAQQVLTSDELTYAADHAHARQNWEALRDTSTTAMRATRGLRSELENPALHTPAALEPALSELRSVLAQVASAGQLHGTLEAELTAQQLTQDERPVLDVIAKVAAERDGRAEIADVLAASGDRSWELVRALYGKRRVRIYISPVGSPDA